MSVLHENLNNFIHNKTLNNRIQKKYAKFQTFVTPDFMVVGQYQLWTFYWHRGCKIGTDM